MILPGHRLFGRSKSDNVCFNNLLLAILEIWGGQILNRLLDVVGSAGQCLGKGLGVCYWRNRCKMENQYGFPVRVVSRKGLSCQRSSLLLQLLQRPLVEWDGKGAPVIKMVKELERVVLLDGRWHFALCMLCTTWRADEDVAGSTLASSTQYGFCNLAWAWNVCGVVLCCPGTPWRLLRRKTTLTYCAILIEVTTVISEMVGSPPWKPCE